MGVTAGARKLGWCLSDRRRGGVFGVVPRLGPRVRSVATVGNGRGDHGGHGWQAWGLLLLLLLLLRLLMMWVWRRRLCVALLVGIVCVPRGVPFVVGVVRSSHAVHHGMTAEILMRVVGHCSRHLGDSATDRQSVFGFCVSVDPVSLVLGTWQLVTQTEVSNHTEGVTRQAELVVVPNRHRRL